MTDREPPFDCPHCGTEITEIGEVATVGNLVGGHYPHAICPQCKQCMGCERVLTGPNWKTQPTFDVEWWLYVDSRDVARLVRVYKKDGKGWMVMKGSRSRIRYGRWLPIGPVPRTVEIIESEMEESQSHRGWLPMPLPKQYDERIPSKPKMSS